jgi:hypothetical protein
MYPVESELSAIEHLLKRTKPAEAEQRCREMLQGITDEQLQYWASDLRILFGNFLPKRRKALLEELAARLNAKTKPATTQAATAIDLAAFEQETRSGLADLSARHIFQWATFYRDFLSQMFVRSIELMEAGAPANEMSRAVLTLLAQHSAEIFTKGYQYTAAFVSSGEPAVAKSISGLQRFLELPIEFYSARVSALRKFVVAKHARTICSAMLTGILLGHSRTAFGDTKGGGVLPRFPRSWAHYVGFLTPADLDALLAELEPGTVRDGLQLSVVPVVQAIHRLINSDDAVRPPLPVLGQVVWDLRRIDITLQLASELEAGRFIEIQAYLDSAYVNLPLLDEAVNRDVAVIAARLKADIHDVVASRDQLKSRMVNTISPDDVSEYTRRVEDLLRFTIARITRVKSHAEPITYNFARDFPLHNPFLTKYFHVYRASVRDLLRTFERRNGVRLWCSVRRSGKTTACFDLSTTTGVSQVVSQTCDSTDRNPNSSAFYEAVIAALGSHEQLPTSFLADVVQSCAGPAVATSRFVFVLDEYETLFERLRLAARRDPELRYAVVQPLLNQMVAFGRDNLLVFVGQRPDAHFILMDQNQLSAYVEQDSFPLFRHVAGALTSEFAELLRKVLSERVSFDSEFVDAVFDETAGHPYLTVNLLVAFVDWMIEVKRQVGELRLTRDDFGRFSLDKLVPAELSVYREYTFFREAVGHALSPEETERNPWLSAVYGSLAMLCQEYKDLRCSRDDFNIIAQLVVGPASARLTGDYLLSTAAQANFIEILPGGEVAPRVKLLGRIAAVAAPRIVT